MNAFTLAWASIKARSLQSWLCIIAAGAGITLLCTVFLLTFALENGIKRNAEGIDIVVGAKGSPLQLILSSIYHVDIPNGNIEQVDAEKLIKNPDVKKAIPLAIGDSYKGWRIVGTTPDYLSLYHAEVGQGTMFSQNFEAVAGALTKLQIGTEFAAMHGFAADGDDIHHFHSYKITGVLKPTGTVIDRMIVTPFNSVQQLHSHPDADDPDGAEEIALGHQITALFIKVKSPVAIMNLPREINKSTSLLAASPGYVMARFSKDMGVGRDVLTMLGVAFIGLSVLVLLSVLTSGLSARKYDLAILRVLGASPTMLAATVMFEGVILSVTGTIFGLVIGHGLAFTGVYLFEGLQGLIVPASLLMPTSFDALLLTVGVISGMVGGLLPTILAARTDIAGLLAKGRL